MRLSKRNETHLFRAGKDWRASRLLLSSQVSREGTTSSGGPSRDSSTNKRPRRDKGKERKSGEFSCGTLTKKSFVQGLVRDGRQLHFVLLSDLQAEGKPERKRTAKSEFNVNFY